MRNPIMIDERVYLRPLELSDGEVMARFDAAESDTFMYRGRQPTSPLVYEHWYKELHTQATPDQIEFAACLRANDQLIGQVGIEQLDWINRTGETGSYFGPGFRNQGYGTEAKHLLLEYCFDRLHLHAICSTVLETNTRSSAALGKQGYRLAGRLHWVDVKDGVYRDMLVYDLFRDEWFAAREAWQASRTAHAVR